MIAAKALALLFLCGSASDDFSEQLARLSAPRAAERAAAERWLQAHLALERYPELAEAALGGDAEVRGRLLRVLSSDARHLPLALRLAAEKSAELGALGREAVRSGVAHSDPRLAEPAVREGLELVLRRAASASPPRRLRLDGRLALAQMVEALELVGELPLGLTLDARLANRTIRREEELPSAPWNELVLHVARAQGVAVELHGLARGRENALGNFLRLTSESGPARTGVDLISEWLLVLAGEGDENARARAALNLAASGFKPAFAWMDHLVLTRADRAALEGLLFAAARGQVEPALLGPTVLEPLLAAAEAQGGPQSARILCALARGGCFDARGGALAERFLTGFETATPRARWIRLFLLERNACAPAEVAPRARALLAERSTPPTLRLQALYALAAQGEGLPVDPPSIEGLPELFRLDLDEGERERLGRVLRLFSPPPHADPAGIPPDWTPSQRLALLEAWLWHGEAAAPAAHVAAWMQVSPAESRSRGELLADALRPWLARGAGPHLVGILRRARELAPAQEGALERVRLLLGLVPAPEVSDVVARGRHELEGERADLALVAALAGYPVPIAAESAARSVLLARLIAALGENRRLQDCAALLRALDLAAGGLYSSGRDEEGDRFASSVLAQCRRSKGELGRWLERQPWPPAPLTETRDVARALARFGVPSSL